MAYLSMSSSAKPEVEGELELRASGNNGFFKNT